MCGASSAASAQPVTFCENYVPWQHKLRELVAELDFISLHTYPVWEYKHVHEAMDYTRDNFDSVARLYPGQAGGHHRGRLGHQLATAAASNRTTPRRSCRRSTCAS